MKKRVDMSGVDWSQSNYAIARGIARTPSLVWRERKRLGIAPSSPYTRVDRQVFDELDWSKTDQENASILGCSHTTVRNERRRRGIRRNRARLLAQHWDAVDWRNSNAEIACKLGCSPNTVRDHRRRIERVRRWSVRDLIVATAKWRNLRDKGVGGA